MRGKSTDKKKLTVIAAGVLAAVTVVFMFVFLFKGKTEISSQRQFFWNNEIIDTEKTTASLVQHKPLKQETVLVFDSLWEGNKAGGFNIVPVEGGYRMYYAVSDNAEGVKICCAQSQDGITWEKPALNIVNFNGDSNNNIIFDADRGITGGFFAFKDTNSSVKDKEKYKAVGFKADGSMEGFVSENGLDWTSCGILIKNVKPSVKDCENLASVFWNEESGKYYCYYSAEKGGKQTVMVITSKNFRKWSKPKAVSYRNKENKFDIATANIIPYFRNEDMLIGLPLRSVDIEDNVKAGVDSAKISDTVFMFSDDAKKFEMSSEAWLTAGPQTEENWKYGDTLTASGIISTPSLHSQQGQDQQLSVFVAENMSGDKQTSLTRYTTRIDGFWSYNAPYNTQKVVTKPVVFDGSRMTLNFRTSTNGYVYVRILDKNGKPFEDIIYTDRRGEEYTVPAYTSYKMIGDRVDREVAFNADLSELSGKTVVIEFYLSDADIYSFKFDNREYENDTQWQPEEIEIRDYTGITYPENGKIIDIGTDRQLFVDDYIVDIENTDAVLTSHSPVMKEEIFKTDLPWEGDNCDFYVIIDDVDSRGNPYFRMYYLGWDSDNFTDIRVCYAYSYDGSQWIKPNLGIHNFTDKKTGQTYTQTNIMLYTEEEIFDNFFVMKDTRPGVPDSQRYKAICQGRYDQLGYPSYGLWAWQSADGLHWKKTHRVLPQDEKWFGSFDSVNSLVWDENTKQFFTYFRVRESQIIDDVDYVDFRKIYGATSGDFVPFDTDTLFRLEYGENSPVFEMYTNNISKYYRAPQMFIGFPTRFSRNFIWQKNYDYLTYPEIRREKFNSGQTTRTLSMTDTMFMTSRDGYLWNRQNEAFFTPGPEYQANWIYGNCYPAFGLIETDSDIPGADRQISTYLFEGKFYDLPSVLYRYVLRLDGFKSYKGTLKPQKVTTKTLNFTGSDMYVNFETSAAGSMTVKILDEKGSEIKGYSAKLIGDNTDRKVVFEGDLVQLNGKNVKIQFVLSDAQIYSFKFE